MNITCADRERIFLDGSSEEWAGLEQHAASCAECREELRAWKALSTAAEELRDYREDAPLWAKIAIRLRQNEPQQGARRGLWEMLGSWRDLSVGWQAALVGALVLVLAVSAVYVAVDHNPPSGPDKLLKNSALAEVERTERDYRKAIDTMAAEAKPQLDSSDSPLMANYREKLLVLDSAINELREETGRNPSNAHLRYQLLAMYQEKQETLQEVLEMKR